MKALQVHFKVPVEMRDENGRFIASCFLLTGPCHGATKHEAITALTDALQAFLAARCADRRLDEMLHQHALHLPHPDEELVTGRYVDVAVQLKIPALN